MGRAKNEDTGMTSDPESDAGGDMRRFFKPGQTKICPNMGDATRGFYESLLKEKPGSLIAIKFCVEHGCLDKDSHNKLLALYLKLKEDGYYSQKRPAILPEVNEDFQIVGKGKKRKNSK